ncbi:MAG TPA: ATP-binding protein [Stellaceae bacterium]|nr:ATP-binding protein [Stellaceae bacterium]
MIAIFTKPIAAINAEDVSELVAQAWPEGYMIEFKKSLPNKKGGEDGWLAGTDQLGAYARDEVLSEVVAFANAQGGNLVLGIKETKEKPPRASAVSPLPRVGELARRFEDAGRSCIDPPLPRLQIHAVETEPDTGKGVVIFRVGPSRNAPHRLTTTLQCYARHGSSTQRMTMRQIQDMSLNVSRGMAGIDATFADRHEKFFAWTNCLQPRTALRATAVPLEQLPDPGRIPDNPRLFPQFRNFDVTVGANRKQIGLFVYSSSDRPILRGIVRTADGGGRNMRAELHQSGLLDIWLALAPREIPGAPSGDPGQLFWYHGNVLGAALQAMWSTSLFRHEVGTPEAEYGLEVEIMRQGAGPVAIYHELFDSLGFNRHDVLETNLLFPRVPFRDETTFEAVLNAIDIDIFDALGVRRTSRTPLMVSF